MVVLLSPKSFESGDTVVAPFKLSPAEHARLLRKLDWNLLPLLALLYLLAFL